MARIAIDFDVNDAQAVAAVNRVKGSIGSVQPPHPAAAQGFTSLHERILDTTGGLQKMARVLVSVQVTMATIATVFGIKHIIEAADAWLLMGGRLRLVTENMTQAAGLQQQLLTLANEIRTPLKATAELYTRLALNTQELNLSQSTMLSITRAVGQALLLSGATAEEAAGGVIQFTQSLAEGNLHGQELRSVLNQMPRLAKALADGLKETNPEFKKLTDSGVSANSALKMWGESGKLVSAVTIPALMSQFKKLDEEFVKLPISSEQAAQKLTNALTALAGEANIQPLVQSIESLRDALADPVMHAQFVQMIQDLIDLTAAGVNAIPTLFDLFNLFVRVPIAMSLKGVGLTLGQINDLAMGTKSYSQILEEAIQNSARMSKETDIAAGAYERLLGEEASLEGFLTGKKPFDVSIIAGIKAETAEIRKKIAAKVAELDAEKLRNRPGAPDDTARMAAAKRLEEAMKVAKLVNDIHLDQAQFEKDQAVKTVDFAIHENKRQYENYAQDETQFIERELTLLEVRKDQELNFLKESAANVKADLALKLRAITAHAADKKNLEDPGLTKIKRNEAELQAFKQSQDLEQKAIDLKRQTEESKAKIVEAAQDRITKIVKEASGARLQREIADLDKALEQVERGSAAETALQAKKYQTLSSQYHADVQAFIDSELLKTGILENETVKRLAKEAGLLKAKQAIGRQIIDDAADLAEQQTRLANNIDAAYSIGFAEAATKADDAFTAMRKSGAEAFQSLKSGLSDFLFDMFTGAKSIGDVFVNLGKRILRSMTDVFAEIIAKQAVMASGFSLTGFLGLGTAVAGAAGMEGAPNAAAKAITGLGTAATGSADALSGMTGVLGLVMRVLTMFGNGLMGILGFFGQIVQGIASGGGIVNTLTTAFSSLVKAGGFLSTVFGGLSSVGGSIMNAFQGVGGLADVFQSAFNALGLGMSTSGFGAGAAVAGGTPGLTGGAGQYATFLADWLPVAGAIYSAVTILQNFIKGNLATAIGGAVGGAIGAVIGSIYGGPIGGFIGFSIGSFIGSFIGGLFAKQPKVRLDSYITPFDRHNMGNAVEGPGGLKGTQVGAGLVNISGNIMKNKQERALQEVLAAMINNLLIHVVDATVLMIKTLPPTIGAQLDAALTDLEKHGLVIDEWSHKGKKAAKRFKQHVEALMGDTLQALTKALDFGDVDLKALGFDPKDPKGKKGGEVARGFEGMMMALGALSAIVKEVGPGVDLAGVSLAQFTAAAISYFKGFAKEGETFTDTIKRVMESIGGIIQTMEQTRAMVAAMTGDVSLAFGILVDQLGTLHDRTVAAADALTIAAESGSTPEEILAAAQATQQALEAELQGVQALKTAVDALNASIITAVDLVIDLTQQMHALRGTELSVDEFKVGLDGIVYLFNAMADVTSRIAIFSAGLIGLSGNLTLFTSILPLVVSGFHIIMDQIRQLGNPTQAIAALKDLAGAVTAGLNAVVAQINRQTQARIAGLEAEKAAFQALFAAQRTALEAQRDLVAASFAAQRTALKDQRDVIAENYNTQRTALEEQRDLINENYDAQRSALEEQLQLAREWSGILDSVKGQLVDLFNLLAPTHPEASYNEVLAQFRAAFAAFQSGPTPEGATKVQDLAKQVLQLAQGVPGMDLPSLAFQALAAEIKAALEAVAAVAGAGETQKALEAQLVALAEAHAVSLDAITAQLAALHEAETSQLASIDAQIAALNAREASHLANIDQHIAAANAAGQAQIAQFQELAAQGLEEIRNQVYLETVVLAAQQAAAAAQLQALLGDKTFEQFIAEKQREAVDVLRGIDLTLQHYLGGILQGLGFPIPSAATGMAYVPQDGPVYLHQGERVLTAAENRNGGSTSGGGQQITFSPQIVVYADERTDGRKVGKEIIQEMKESILYGDLNSTIQKVAGKR